VDSLAQAVAQNRTALLALTALKNYDNYTFTHMVNVSILTMGQARGLGIEGGLLREFGLAALMHDIGKVKTPNEVLNKPGKLTDEELALIRDHPALGHEILSRHADMPKMVLDITRHHHERLDGKGYPDGLTASEISLHVRICTVCDVYDAVTSVRPYKKPWTHMDAVNWMMGQQGAFDREILHEFFSSMETIMETRRRA
jgi:putative nucleotidyltransferase with HDIG domain